MRGRVSVWTIVPGFPTRFIPGDLPQAGFGAFVELRYRM